jgi:hypothetical protein
VTDAAFRAAVREALARAEGGPLGRRIRAATVTAIVADARGDERDTEALAELVGALERAGVPRGRQFVLLGAEAPDAGVAKARASALRASLGVVVMAHDPEARSRFAAGVLPSGAPVELDDELREAEEVLVVGRFGRAADGSLRGGPALVWPGLASARARAARPVPGDALGGLREAEAALAFAPADFALFWSGDEPPRVRAGTPAAVAAACVSEGWLDGTAARG